MNHHAPRCPNPFTCDGDTLGGLLIGLLDEAAPDAGDSVFRGRAVALVRAVAPVLAWVRDHKGVRIDLGQIQSAMALPNLCSLAAYRVFRVRQPASRSVAEVSVADMPEALVGPVRAYLCDLPGYDDRLPGGRQGRAAPGQVHDHALSMFAHALARSDAAADRS